MDVAAYLERIGYRGRVTATLETLRQIHSRHPAAIAFENLDAFSGSTANLEIESIERKLVAGGRGGWCFEHNLLLSSVLRELGFDVRELAARVLWNAPESVMRPRTHMVLLVTAEAQRYLVDVGFGGLTLTAPLRFEADIEQTTPHERFRMLETGDEFLLQAAVQEGWKSLYRFDLQPQTCADYELTNWYLSNHPHSHFRSHLVVARPAVDRRYVLLDDQLTVYYPSGESERRTLADVAELRAVLTEIFLLRLGDVPTLERTLQRVFQPDEQVSPGKQ